ncbi:MAG: hypothetical protein ACYTXY_32190, partial [Nostoc sp.]
SPAVSGEGGSIFIKTNTLSLTNGSTLNVAANGQGNAGNIFIDTRSLSVTGGAQISAGSSGLNAGNVAINARDTVKVDGFGVDQNGQVMLRENGEPALSQIISGVSGSGQGGDIRITTGSLFVTNGGQLTANTFGQGNAGDIIVNARDFISLSGRFDQGSFDEPSALLARTTNSGQGGNINIITRSLSVTDGARLNASTSGQGNAGNITVNADDKLTISGIDPSYNERSTKFSDNVLNIGANSGLFVSSTSSGITGDIEVNSPQITLDNQGELNASSASGNGGNINVNSDLLLLRHGAQISTTAGNHEFGGDGGNINIKSKFIVAVPNENSDISANAYTGI